MRSFVTQNERTARRTVLQAIVGATSVLSISSALPCLGMGTQHRRGALAALEQKYGGRLGVASLDTKTATGLSYRANESFPLCSTSKFLSAAFILARVDRGEEQLSRTVIYSKNNLVPHSPVTALHHDGAGMTLAEICRAAMKESDNTAANLMLESFGGPAVLTGYLRTLGDTNTRLDPYEPALNEAVPGDPRDSTTPTAMLALMRKILLETALSPASQARLTEWLIACRTGEKRLRAGAPKFWRSGDKTGTGDYNTTNDIAIFWPADRAPVLVAAYYTGSHATDIERDAVLAEVGRIAIT